MVKATIVNVVATAALNQGVDLGELRKFREIFHDSDVYGGRVAYFKSPKMRGKVTIFPSGKMISVGTTSEIEATRELENARDFLVEKGVLTFTRIKHEIQNIVAKLDFGKRIDLEKLAKNHRIIYEPEQFPGGILRVEEPYKATLLLFASGKAVITGLRNSNQINSIAQEVENLIR